MQLKFFVPSLLFSLSASSAFSMETPPPGRTVGHLELAHVNAREVAQLLDPFNGKVNVSEGWNNKELFLAGPQSEINKAIAFIKAHIDVPPQIAKTQMEPMLEMAQSTTYKFSGGRLGDNIVSRLSLDGTESQEPTPSPLAQNIIFSTCESDENLKFTRLRCGTAGLGVSHDIWRSNETPLHIAAKHGALETARYLLEAGANPNAFCKESPYVSWPTTQTPLLYCLTHYKLEKVSKGTYKTGNHIKIFKLILEHGADPDFQTPVSKETALHLAASCNTIPTEDKRVKIAKILFDFGVDLALEDHTGKTALESAQMYRHQHLTRTIEYEIRNRRLNDNFIERLKFQEKRNRIAKAGLPASVRLFTSTL